MSTWKQGLGQGLMSWDLSLAREKMGSFPWIYTQRAQGLSLNQ